MWAIWLLVGAHLPSSVGSSFGLAVVILEWRTRKWNKCIYTFMFLACLNSWHLFAHFYTFYSMKPCPCSSSCPVSVILSVHPGPAAPTSPRNLLKMQIFSLYPRPTLSDTLAVRSKDLCFNKLRGILRPLVGLLQGTKISAPPPQFYISSSPYFSALNVIQRYNNNLITAFQKEGRLSRLHCTHPKCIRQDMTFEITPIWETRKHRHLGCPISDSNNLRLLKQWFPLDLFSHRTQSRTQEKKSQEKLLFLGSGKKFQQIQWCAQHRKERDYVKIAGTHLAD